LMDEIYHTVFKYRGTITAEHGVGRLRTNYLKKEWGGKDFRIHAGGKGYL